MMLIKNIIEWLKKPYYYNQSDTFKIYVSIGVGVIVFILLLIFEPANINNQLVINPTLFKFLIGFISIVNLLCFFFFVTKLLPNFFNEQNWTVGKHIAIIITLIVFSSIIRWLVTNYFLAEDYELEIGLLTIIKYSFNVGIIPVLLYVYFDEKYHYNKYKGSSKKIHIYSKISPNKKVTIYATNNKDNLTFKIDDLVYVTNERNYACFFIKETNNIKEYILRKPLISVEKELANFNNIFRCHKSYIINSNHIKEVSGNARGYYLKLKKTNQMIPISRSFDYRKLFLNAK